MKYQSGQSKIIFTLGVLTAILLLAACAQTKNPKFTEIEGQLEELSTKRNAYQEELAKMSVPQLFEILQKESLESKEPFNSMAFSEMVSRGENAAPELQSLLEEPTQGALLGLLALRQMDRGLYQEMNADFRIAVLVDALQNSQFFNTWGLPHLYWEDAAQTLIEEGKAATPALMKLLDDPGPAPMWGQEEVVEYEAYKYRIRDYAWAIIMAISGEKLEIPQDPDERDELIRKTIGQ